MLCGESEFCTYVFAVYNPATVAVTRKASLIVRRENENSEDITPGESYRNYIKMGQFVYYRILDAQFDLEYISALIIDVETYTGDADLFVSTSENMTRPNVTHFEYESRRNDRFDRIVLNDTVHEWLSDFIYIGVYGNLRSEFELTITPIYHP